MILVTDISVTERALDLRDAIFKAGFPVALAPLCEVTRYRPIRLLVSFADICDDIAKTPIGAVCTVVIGTEFVNSALGMIKADDTRSALEQIDAQLSLLYGITPALESAFGFSPTPALFIAEDFFAVRGNVIEPTPSEYMIFKFLMSFAGSDVCFTAERIAEFCLPRQNYRASAASIPVHIANLNRKLENVCSERVIRSKRDRGYYAVRV